MKILVLQDILRSGGTERQSILLTAAFAAAGHQATLLTFRPGGPLAPHGGMTSVSSGSNSSTGFPARVLQDARAGKPVPLSASLQPFDTGLDWFAPGLVRKISRLSPDVILCMGRMANCRAGGLQRKFPGIAVVATMRTGKPLSWLFRRSLRRARHVIANSREARDRLINQEGIPHEKITVIANSLVFPSSDQTSVVAERANVSSEARPETLRAHFNATPATTILLSVAMFRPEKNQRELVEIVSGLPPGLDWQLWLAGDGPERAACEKLVADRNLGARVKFPGFYADPRPLYLAADIAVHASRSEALSNFLIEAQAHGLPAVAYDAQGIRECFLPGNTGWPIAPGDRPGFVARLTQLIRASPAEKAARAAAARAFAAAAFDPARQAAAYLELFQRLLG